MNLALLFVSFVCGLILGYLFLWRKHRTNYLALSEYWVYLPGESMPEQNLLLDRMVGKNPYAMPGYFPIGTTEGAILSDVRLHIALVLRSKNPHVFRPDIFEEIPVTLEQSDVLAASKSLVKVRYASEQPLKEKKHLQFLIHAADAMADLGDGKAIYDFTGQTLYLKADFEELLRKNRNATGSAIHVRTIWRDLAEGCVAETRGMAKMGLPDLKTGPMEADERVLITTVLDEAVSKLWDLQETPEAVEVEAYDDRFRVTFGRPERGFAATRILRMQAQ